MQNFQTHNKILIKYASTEERMHNLQFPIKIHLNITYLKKKCKNCQFTRYIRFLCTMPEEKDA